jgi:hypothetical protein
LSAYIAASRAVHGAGDRGGRGERVERRACGEQHLASFDQVEREDVHRRGRFGEVVELDVAAHEPSQRAIGDEMVALLYRLRP